MIVRYRGISLLSKAELLDKDREHAHKAFSGCGRNMAASQLLNA
jgi:hypothetical protein